MAREVSTSDWPGLPQDIDAWRSEFSYSCWTPNTQVTFCNVPWDSTYRDVVRFNTDGERTAWFRSRMNLGVHMEIKGMVYLRMGEPIRVNIPFDMAMHFNYLVVINQTQPVHPVKQGMRTPERYYYFINDCTYIAPNTTQLNVQLDVWQTYYDRVVFNQCYVNRGHIAIANENSNPDNISDYLTDPEGLQYGDEYDIVHQEFISFQDDDKSMIGLIMSSANLTGNFGSTGSPNLSTAQGCTVGGIPMGCEMYACDNLPLVMRALSSYSWISQCIQMITIVPRRYVSLGEEFTLSGGAAAQAKLYRINETDMPRLDYNIASVREKFSIDPRYKNLHKFYMSPYTYLEMTYQNGAVVALKPECFYVDQDGDATLHTRASIVPPDVRIVGYFDRYNAAYEDGGIDYSYWTVSDGHGGAESVPGNIPSGEGLDLALTITGFPQVSIVNNMYQYYLASTTNQRSYAFSSADWSYQKSMAGANNTLANAKLGIANANDNLTAQVQNYNAMADAATDYAGQMGVAQSSKNLSSAISGGIGSGLNVGAGLAGLLSGGVSGAVNAASGIGDLVGGAIDAAANQQYLIDSMTATGNNITATNAARIALASQTNANNAYYGAKQADNNYNLAAYAAQGDYQNAIQGIQAKVQDAAITQPTLSGQLGGDLFNLANGFTGILIKWKRVKRNYMRQIGDYWLRYGYYVNRWIVPPGDLKCMTNFTYWKMQSVSLGGDEVPELYRETIRGIFEKGVTVWTAPDKMYTSDLAENEPIGGIAY